MLTQWPKKGSVGQVATIEINEFTNRIHVQLIKTYSYTDSNIKQSRQYCSILHLIFVITETW